MEYEARAARNYRARAEALMTLAELDRVETTRSILLGVADSYEAMAKSFEAILHSRREALPIERPQA